MNTRPCTCRDLIRAQLRRLRCDALACPDAECGCGIDDLVPCGGDPSGCEPARSKVTPDGVVLVPAGIVARKGEG